MNCDEAFDAITNLDQASAPALKWHLEFCPRCREMQQILAPALALFFGENEPAGSHSGLEAAADLTHHRLGSLAASAAPRECSPQNRAPFLTPEAVQLAEQTARGLQSAAPARREKFWRRWTAVCVVCFLMLMGVYQFQVSGPAPRSPSAHHAEPLMLADQCLWTERDTDSNLLQRTDAPSSRWVVLSCVSCHLEQSLE